MDAVDIEPAHESSAARANAARNGTRRAFLRKRLWRGARRSAWRVLDGHIPRGARVAIIGAGSGDDLPLRKLGARASEIDLIDIDPHAVEIANAKLRRTRAQIRVLIEDVTGGAADSVVRRAAGEAIEVVMPPAESIGRGEYDVVIGDLLYTQLLAPALSDLGIGPRKVDELLTRYGQRITNGVVARMHTSAPDGVVVHLHDLLCWTSASPQRFAMDDVLRLAPDEALELVHTGVLPWGCDPREGSERAGMRIVDTAFYRWNFGLGKEFLVCASVARGS